MAAMRSVSYLVDIDYLAQGSINSVIGELQFALVVSTESGTDCFTSNSRYTGGHSSDLSFQPNPCETQPDRSLDNLPDQRQYVSMVNSPTLSKALES